MPQRHQTDPAGCQAAWAAWTTRTTQHILRPRVARCALEAPDTPQRVAIPCAACPHQAFAAPVAPYHVPGARFQPAELIRGSWPKARFLDGFALRAKAVTSMAADGESIQQCMTLKRVQQ